MTAYQKKLLEVRNRAETVCSINGDDHETCIEAYEVLETLEQYDDCSYEIMLDSLERYCATHPDAQECRIFQQMHHDH